MLVASKDVESTTTAGSPFAACRDVSNDPTQDESQDGSLIGGQKRTCIGAVRNRGQHRGGVRGQQRGGVRGQHLRVWRPVSHDEERRRQ